MSSGRGCDSHPRFLYSPAAELTFRGFFRFKKGRYPNWNQQHSIANRENTPPPDLTTRLRPQIGADWKLRQDRLSFFRSYLVLNSVYYLSEKDILDLDLSTEAIYAPYENISNSSDVKRCQFLLVKYENQQRAQKALKHFHSVYLPEYEKLSTNESTDKIPRLFKLEDGWLAHQLIGKHIAIVFESPHRETAQQIIQRTESSLLKKEDE